MKFKKPNFQYEWEEAKLRKGLFSSKQEWLKTAVTGSPQIIDCSMNLGNTDMCDDDRDLEDLNPDKVKRAKEALKRGIIELPIVLHVEDRYEILGGNTRLTAMKKANIPAYAWVIELPDKKIEDLFIDGYDEENFYDYQSMEETKDMIEKWSQKYKNSIDCNNPKGFSQRAHCQGKKKKIEAKETDASSSGSYIGSAFGKFMSKREIYKLHNANLKEEVELDEVTDASSSGSYDVPFLGKTPKGRKNPLKIDGPDSIYNNRAVKDKKFPRFGGPNGIYVKVKEKCKKFPYCNQGNTGALEFIRENQDIKNSIMEISKKMGIPYKEIEKLVLNEINKIFI